MRGRASRVGIIAAGALLIAASAPVNAALVTLTDKNSIVDFDTENQAGQFNWLVDGIDHIHQQWFWFRVGNAGPEQSLDTVPLTGSNVSNSDLDPGNETLVAQYTSAGFEITVQYTLTGGTLGSGTSDLAETISIENITGAPLDFHFFQYVDFDLLGTATDTLVQFINANTALQQDGFASLSESVNTTIGAATTHREVNFFSNTLNKLNDALPTTLDDNVGPIGPGDLTWAFQWDFNIAPGSTVIISKDKLLAVPEPASAALLAAGLLPLVLRRRRD